MTAETSQGSGRFHRGTRGASPAARQILLGEARCDPSMAPGRFTRWSLRWGPGLGILATAVALANALGDTFVWRLAEPAAVSSWIIAGVLAFGAVALFVDRRSGTALAIPAAR
jgi:hypothetical protein